MESRAETWSKDTKQFEVDYKALNMSPKFYNTDWLQTFSHWKHKGFIETNSEVCIYIVFLKIERVQNELNR